MKRLISLATSCALVGVLVCAPGTSVQAFELAQEVGVSTNADIGYDGNVDEDPEIEGRGEADTHTESGVTAHGNVASFTLSQEQASSASLDAESSSLDATSVSTHEDLSLYATGKLKRDSNIANVDVSGDRVSLEYRKKARFLGFIPGSIRATAEVTSDGEVDIDYPWYRFLFAVQGSSGTEAALKARVSELTRGADLSGGFTAKLEAELLDALYTALAASADVTGGAGTTADMSGPGEEDGNLGATSTGEASGSADIYPN